MTKAFNLGQHLYRSMINAGDFGARGDGVTDDFAAITDALAAAAEGGGGSWVFLPPTGNGYRITQGLKLPSYVGLLGASPSRFPFDAGSPNVSRIIADFANPNQWVIEPMTTSGGDPIGYNTPLPGLPDGATYNCAVKDLIVMSATGAMPFGGIRMHGCPGSLVEDVAIYNTSAGLWVDMCFGGEYTVHCLTVNYGVISWSGANGCKFSVYAARKEGETGVVPPQYVMKFLDDLKTNLTAFYNLSTNAHYNRAWGVIIGAPPGETVQGTVADLLAERFSGGLLMLGAGSTVITRLYTEAIDNTGLAVSHSNVHVGGFHAYYSGLGQAIDMGDSLSANVYFTGIIYVDKLGKLPLVDNSSNVLLWGIGPGFKGVGATIVQNQFNVYYPDHDGPWIEPGTAGAPPLNAPAVSSADPQENFAYRINRNNIVEMKGGLSALPAKPFVAFTLPAGFRPFKIGYFAGASGADWSVEPNGNVSVITGGASAWATGIHFQQSF